MKTNITDITYKHIYLDNYACKIVGRQMTDYLHDNLFETDKD